MSQQALPMACEGTRVRLLPGYAKLRIGARAGRQSGEEEADNMLFAAGRGIGASDLIAGFWRDEATSMDWLEDFLRDPDMARLILDLQEDNEEEEEVREEHYDRRGLCQFGADEINAP
jgi:hypothetical protein